MKKVLMSFLIALMLLTSLTGSVQAEELFSYECSDPENRVAIVDNLNILSAPDKSLCNALERLSQYTNMLIIAEDLDGIEDLDAAMTDFQNQYLSYRTGIALAISDSGQSYLYMPGGIIWEMEDEDISALADTIASLASEQKFDEAVQAAVFGIEKYQEDFGYGIFSPTVIVLFILSVASSLGLCFLGLVLVAVYGNAGAFIDHGNVKGSFKKLSLVQGRVKRGFCIFAGDTDKNRRLKQREKI